MTHSQIFNLLSSFSRVLKVLAVCIFGIVTFSSSSIAQSCSDESACNYSISQSYCIRVEQIATHSGMVGTDNLDGMTTYRVYALLENSDDVLSAMIGDAEHPGYFNTTTEFFQHNIGGVTPSGINPAFINLTLN